MPKTETTAPSPMTAALKAAGVIRQAIQAHELRRGELTAERAELTRLIEHHWNAPLDADDVRQALCKMIDAKMAAAERALNWPVALQQLVHPLGERRRRQGDDFIMLPAVSGTAPALCLADVHAQHLQVFGARIGPISLGARAGLLGEGEATAAPLLDVLYVLLGEQLKQRTIEVFDSIHFKALAPKDGDPCANLSADLRAEAISGMELRASQIDEELRQIDAEIKQLRATVA